MASKELSTNDLQEFLTFTLTVAKSAGNLILEGSKAILASGNVDEKKNSVDLVTEYDVRVEELVKGELNKQYPTFQLYVRISSVEANYAGSRSSYLFKYVTFLFRLFRSTLDRIAHLN